MSMFKTLDASLVNEIIDEREFLKKDQKDKIGHITVANDIDLDALVAKVDENALNKGDFTDGGEWNVETSGTLPLPTSPGQVFVVTGINQIDGKDYVEGDVLIALSELAEGDTPVSGDFTLIDNTESADLLKVSSVDTDGTLAGNSDDLIASQKAVKKYVDDAIAGVEETDLTGVNTRIDSIKTVTSDAIEIVDNDPDSTITLPENAISIINVHIVGMADLANGFEFTSGTNEVVLPSDLSLVTKSAIVTYLVVA